MAKIVKHVRLFWRNENERLHEEDYRVGMTDEDIIDEKAQKIKLEKIEIVED